MDEYHRMRTTGARPYQVPSYPLIDLGLNRVDCQNVIRDAGLPTPERSACFFCPYQTMAEWQHRRKVQPLEFRAAVYLEQEINRKRKAMGRDPVWLSGGRRPLEDAVGDHEQLDMFEGGCDIAGYCHS
jgi:hypothetical protein